MSLPEWIHADPEWQYHAQFCPICAAANADDDTTTEEGPA